MGKKAPSRENDPAAMFPFAAMVGQDDMKLGLILNVIDPSIGGLLIMGEKGTGKSTAVRALAALVQARLHPQASPPAAAGSFPEGIIGPGKMAPHD